MDQKLTKAFAILLLLFAGLACSLASSLLRPKAQRNWHLVVEIAPTESDKEAILRQTISVIERRLDVAGVPNVQVEAQSASGNRILVNLPSVPDQERIKNLITAGGKLELVAVISPPSPAPVQSFDSRKEAAAFMTGRDPAKVRILPYLERDEPATTGRDVTVSLHQVKWVLVEVPAIVDGSELRTASAVSMTGGEDYQIMFSLRPEGATKFGTWTAANINNYLGVVLNDEVKSIAFIKSQIFDTGEITGRFTKQSAEDLALVLQSGALPAPVKIVAETFDK